MRLACSCFRKARTSARILPFGASMNCASSFSTISASEKWPSQSSRMMRPVPSTRIAPSGKSTTGSSVVPPQRHPAANVGTLSSVSSATLPLRLFCVRRNPKSPRRRPARLHIGEVERVELRPQDVALVAQCLNDALLIGPCSRVVERIPDRESRIFRSLRQPRLEIIKPRRHPGIVLAQLFHPQRDQVARKKFGQRRSDALDKWPHAHEVEIFIADKARGRQNLSRAHHPFSLKSRSFRQLDPAQDSTLAPLVAVVIHNAFAPDAAERRIGRARKNDRVLDRNDRLIVIPIQRPGLQLSAAKLAFVHEQMKRMLMVITLLADLAQRRAQFLKRKLGRVRRV